MTREEVKKIEILSPAKNLEYGKEVILCGADAVYIGAPKYTMRIDYSNTIDDIKELVEFAHKYWAKVYITLNTLIYSQEDIATAQNLINEIYRIKADGIIIQDLGMLELDLPPIPIIISVNAMCTSVEDAVFYEKCGVSKIVLSRQISLTEIENISKNTTIPLEMFCYGYFCVGRDGNCYLSYTENLLKSNSCEFAHYHASNYGYCPERCMRNWTLYDADNNIIRENDRLMNLKYLSLIDEMETLVKTGIESYKIAGREKDIKHAKNSTAMFSLKANEVAKKLNIKRASSGRTILGFEPSPEKNFNKDFSTMFLRGRNKEMYSKYTLVGQNVGRVMKFENDTFTLDTGFKLNTGDRLRYQIDDNEVQTIEITEAVNGSYKINHIDDDIKGLELYRYIDAKGFKEVEDSVNYRVISVKLKFNEETVEATDEDGNTIKTLYPKGAKKIGNTPKAFHYLDKNCEFIIDEVEAISDIFINDINEFRNNIFVLLREERAKNRPVDKVQIKKNNVRYFKKEVDCYRNVNNEKSKEFFKRHGVEKITSGLETSPDIENKRILNTKYCLRYELGYCSKDNPADMPKLPWKIKQVESDITYDVEFDCKNCEMSFYYKKEKKQ